MYVGSDRLFHRRRRTGPVQAQSSLKCLLCGNIVHLLHGISSIVKCLVGLVKYLRVVHANNPADTTTGVPTRSKIPSSAIRGRPAPSFLHLLLHLHLSLQFLLPPLHFFLSDLQLSQLPFQMFAGLHRRTCRRGAGMAPVVPDLLRLRRHAKHGRHAHRPVQIL